MVATTTPQARTVADPNAAYESMEVLWRRSRAACAGERFVKEFDRTLDRFQFSNLLIPFSPTMTDQQYAFYKAEAEWPGITSQYARIVISGLLRKKPQLKLPEDAPEVARDWLLNQFSKDNASMLSFLDDALREELQTSRCWVMVDYPKIENAEDLTREEQLELKPYPILIKAETIINWQVDKDKDTGAYKLNQLVLRGYEEKYENNEFHPEYYDVVWVHDLDEAGYYRIRKYIRLSQAVDIPVINGQLIQQNTKVNLELVETNTNILMAGERLRIIPAWPLNGSIEPQEPALTPIIDKEVSLYNKMSRRNHLLYGAATYTPIIASNMSDDMFDNIVQSGLGTWIHLQQGDTADILKTPTDALKDMESAIASSLEEIAKLGIRMLTPETDQSGVALELRNAAQTAQLGTLNTKVSTVMGDIIAFMLNWRYGTSYIAADINFMLSEDFNPMPLGADWLRLVTEWYEAGLLPRSVWMQLLKSNDIVPPEYDDDEGIKEINSDELIVKPSDNVNPRVDQIKNKEILDKLREQM